MKASSHLGRAIVAIAASTCLFAGAASAVNSYQVRNIVSDGGVPADHRDPNLVNGWGVVFNPTGFVWVADNGTGLSTLYDGLGNPQSLVVSVPGLNGDTGAPTGIVFSGSNDFQVASNGRTGPARFIFATEEGIIAGWAPSVDGTHALHAVFVGGAVYKGLALAQDNGVNTLYAADFAGDKIDVFGPTFNLRKLAPGLFVDPNLPAGYGPFNVQAVGNRILVAYAKHGDGIDEEHGPGEGFIDAYDSAGHLIARLVSRGPLNAPWGMVMAPAGFGDFSNMLLVGNFGDGALNAFDPNTGAFLGPLRAPDGSAVVIDGLWGFAFGNGLNSQPVNTLFFAAGPNDESNGVYGRIDATVP